MSPGARPIAQLPAEFFARECLEVAVDLLGKRLLHDDVVLRITEVEAYRAGGDTASHCRFGQTPRSATMFGPPGRAYVYLCYGVHNLLNVVTERAGIGAAVLVRSCDLAAGAEEVLTRRGADRVTAGLLAGPGKVGAALAVDRTWSGHALFQPGGLELHDGAAVPTFSVGPRVGIGYATPRHQSAPWRIALTDSRAVSHRAQLRPYTQGRDAFLQSQRAVA